MLGTGPADDDPLPSIGCADPGLMLLRMEALSDGLATSFSTDVAKEGNWSLLLPQPLPYEG